MATADELARLRIEEETKKIISQTSRNRKLKQRQLIGDEAEEIAQRKDHVEDAKQQWSEKGTKGQSHGSETIERNVASMAKQSYEENLKKANEKGKTEVRETSGISSNLKEKFDKPTKVPALFDNKSGNKESENSESQTAANSTENPHGFALVEKQEEKMVGTSKHIITTGIDSAGRRLTKTKIILAAQVGTTKAQHQEGTASKNSGEEVNNKLMPTSWDGNYYSLVDLRQRRVDGIDKNNREQYLSPDDFEEAFKMSKEEFSKLPKWKRDNLKRNLHLF